VLEEHSITPVGSAESFPINVRFLSATNSDIELLASDGRFREDLLYRLRQGGTVALPALRYRKEDIPLLVSAFICQAETANPNALPREIEPDVLGKLQAHEWPGNVRELRDCIWQAVLHNPDVEHLVPDHILFQRTATHAPMYVHSTPITAASAVERLLTNLNSTDLADCGPSDFAGRLQELENTWGALMGRLLKAALESTRRRTPDNPDGEALPLPALKYLTGNKNLEPWQAYDIINRILDLAPDVANELLHDARYKTAVEKASKRKKKQTGA
jgi:DNA-binding NtrC family response regulator